ncbi:11785_t:CDS:2, partial [Gigaspora rosea]
STAGTSLPSNPPQVVTVHTYDDGSILVSIAREIYSTQKTNSTQEYNCIGQSIEPILRLRIIQLDGTIKEINPHLSLDLMNFYQIVPFLSIAAVNTFLYLSTRSKKTVPDSLVQIINTASAGLFSASHTTFSSIFSFSDVNNYAAFSITSKILWIVPLTINIIVFTYIMYKRGLSEMTIMNLITIALTFYNSETFLLVNKAQIDSLFGKEFESTAKWRAIADVLLKSIPQLIIQIIYFNIIVTYSVIPFFTLCATAFMIFLSAIQAILSVITNGVDNKKKDEETNNEKKDVKKDEDEGDKKGDNNQEKK